MEITDENLWTLFALKWLPSSTTHPPAKDHNSQPLLLEIALLLHQTMINKKLFKLLKLLCRSETPSIRQGYNVMKLNHPHCPLS